MGSYFCYDSQEVFCKISVYCAFFLSIHIIKKGIFHEESIRAFYAVFEATGLGRCGNTSKLTKKRLSLFGAF